MQIKPESSGESCWLDGSPICTLTDSIIATSSAHHHDTTTAADSGSVRVQNAQSILFQANDSVPSTTTNTTSSLPTTLPSPGGGGEGLSNPSRPSYHYQQPHHALCTSSASSVPLYLSPPSSTPPQQFFKLDQDLDTSEPLRQELGFSAPLSHLDPPTSLSHGIEPSKVLTRDLCSSEPLSEHLEPTAPSEYCLSSGAATETQTCDIYNL